jgi:hypothetical protein
MGLVHPPTEFIWSRNRFLSRLLRRGACTKHLVRAFLLFGVPVPKETPLDPRRDRIGRPRCRPPVPLRRTDPASSWFSAIAAGLRLTKVHSPSSFSKINRSLDWRSVFIRLPSQSSPLRAGCSPAASHAALLLPRRDCPAARGGASGRGALREARRGARVRWPRAYGRPPGYPKRLQAPGQGGAGYPGPGHLPWHGAC